MCPFVVGAGGGLCHTQWPSPGSPGAPSSSHGGSVLGLLGSVLSTPRTLTPATALTPPSREGSPAVSLSLISLVTGLLEIWCKCSQVHFYGAGLGCVWG